MIDGIYNTWLALMHSLHAVHYVEIKIEFEFWKFIYLLLFVYDH